MREIIVYAYWIGLPETYKIGILRLEKSRREEVFSFEFSESWLPTF
jgi:hypothetical protein